MGNTLLRDAPSIDTSEPRWYRDMAIIEAMTAGKIDFPNDWRDYFVCVYRDSTPTPSARGTRLLCHWAPKAIPRLGTIIYARIAPLLYVAHIHRAAPLQNGLNHYFKKFDMHYDHGASLGFVVLAVMANPKRGQPYADTLRVLSRYDPDLFRLPLGYIGDRDATHFDIFSVMMMYSTHKNNDVWYHALMQICPTAAPPQLVTRQPRYRDVALPSAPVENAFETMEANAGTSEAAVVEISEVITPASTSAPSPVNPIYEAGYSTPGNFE